jgi:hypothetical protein
MMSDVIDSLRQTVRVARVRIENEEAQRTAELKLWREQTDKIQEAFNDGEVAECISIQIEQLLGTINAEACQGHTGFCWSPNFGYIYNPTVKEQEARKKRRRKVVNGVIEALRNLGFAVQPLCDHGHDWSWCQGDYYSTCELRVMVDWNPTK